MQNGKPARLSVGLWIAVGLGIVAGATACAPEQTCAAASTVHIGDAVFRADPALNVSVHDKAGRSWTPCPDRQGRQVGDYLSKRLDNAGTVVGLAVRRDDDPSIPLAPTHRDTPRTPHGDFWRADERGQAMFVLRDRATPAQTDVIHCDTELFLDVEERPVGHRCSIYLILGRSAQGRAVFYLRTLQPDDVADARFAVLDILDQMRVSAGATSTQAPQP